MRTAERAAARVFPQEVRPAGRPAVMAVFLRNGAAVLDVAYLLGAVVLFLLVGLIAKAVERL